MKLIQNEKGLCLQDDAGLSLMEGLGCGVKAFGEDACHFGSVAWRIRQEGDCWIAESADAEVKLQEARGGALLSTRFCSPVALKDGEAFVMLAGTVVAPVKRAFGFKRDGKRNPNMLEMQNDWQQTDFSGARPFVCVEHMQGEGKDGRTWVGGFVTALHYFSLLTLEADGKLQARQMLEHHPVEAGEWLESDLFWFRTGTDFLADQEDYCDLSAEKMGGARKKFEAPVGYCTWYYYLEHIYGHEVLANLPPLMKEKASGRLPFKYVQIDHGWFDYCGDWEPNEKFPLGMKAYADKIKEAGFIPGIWFIPFGAHKDSRVFKTHPEYMAKRWDSDEAADDGNGRAQLDYSLPEAREYLARQVRKFTYEWGFRYLKMDIVAQTLGTDRFADPKFNSLMNYRTALRVIMENVPEDTFLLGCTAPFMPAIGLVDSMRIGPDVVPEWPRVCGPYSQVMNHFALNGRFFIADGDCLEVHGKENEDQYCTLPTSITWEEKLLYSSAMAAAGGTFMTSDKVGLMSEEQLNLMNKQFPHDAAGSRPLDFGKGSHPSMLDAGERNGVDRMIFLNWTEEEKSFSRSCPHCHVFDFWQKAYLGVMDEISFSLKPHTCRVLYFADAKQQCGMIGCDDVILPAFSCVKTEKGISFYYGKPGESLWMAAPASVTPVLDGGKLEKVAEGVWRCTAEAGLDLKQEYHLNW